MNCFTKQKLTHGQRKLTYGCLEEGGWRGLDWEFKISRCNYYIQDRQKTRSYYTTQGTIFSILYILYIYIYITIFIYIFISESLCYTTEVNTTF